MSDKSVISDKSDNLGLMFRYIEIHKFNYIYIGI